jgi:L-serine dehydratase
MAAIKAINAAWLALAGDGTHIVSLDQVIKTIKQTGEDMKRHYKETSLGGLAINVGITEC